MIEACPRTGGVRHGSGRNSCTDLFNTYETSLSYGSASYPAGHCRLQFLFRFTDCRPDSSATGPIVYTAIGASDGIGFGSSSPCFPSQNVPDGAGYVQILRRDLVATGRTVTHQNLSIPGAVLSRAVEDLARDIGRTISESPAISSNGNLSSCPPTAPI